MQRDVTLFLSSTDRAVCVLMVGAEQSDQEIWRPSRVVLLEVMYFVLHLVPGVVMGGEESMVCCDRAGEILMSVCGG